MSLFTSSQFASAAARGTDWRDCAKTVLEQLESIQTENVTFNLGILYISDHLADDADSILNLFKSVLNIEHWVGSVAVGVCGCGEAYVDEPAISAMIGAFGADDFCLFPTANSDFQDAEDALKPWLAAHDPMLVLAHGDPIAEEDPAKTLETINAITQGFTVGGLSSSRRQQIQFSGTSQSNGVSGVVFADHVQVATSLSQGCSAIGEMHDITRGDEDLILELDHKRAVSVFEDDLKDMAMRALDGRDPDEIMVDQAAASDSSAAPKEFQSLLKGEIHVAFPVSESDQNDYLVRDLIGLDPDEGSITVSQYVSSGERAMFVRRDENTVYEDLSKSLLQLRKRVQGASGAFKPKGAIYVSCVARANHNSKDEERNELKLIQDIIGDVPLCGFYAGGEISNGRLYGYSGILTLFL